MRRLLAVPAIAFVALVALASAAAAHVDVDAEEAVAGATTTLTFSFHHGKDGTATTGLEVQLPPGTVIVDTPEVPGWTVEVDEANGTVVWSGGSVPDGDHGTFPVVVTLPDAEGELLLPVVQLTEAGELAWIQEDGGDEEGSYPAPRLTLAPNPNPTTTTEAAATTEATTTTEGEDDEERTSTTRRAGSTLEADQEGEGGESLAPWLIGAGIAAVVIVAGGGYALKVRRDRAA